MIPVIEELNGFRRATEEEWIARCEDGDRAMLELEINGNYESMWFVKGDLNKHEN